MAEVDTLLVQESGAGAAFGPHMAPLGGGGGGGGGGCLSRRRCKYCNETLIIKTLHIKHKTLNVTNVHEAKVLSAQLQQDCALQLCR